MSSLPLVSCIMPTANRRVFFPRAIALFLAQDYPNKQLVIVEDGGENNADLVPVSPSIRYERTSSNDALSSIGEKRNIACAVASGDLIAHWDDDDWHAPTRLSKQVAALQAKRGRLTGLDRLVFYDEANVRARLFQTVRVPWLAGGSLVYERTLGQEQPFQLVSRGEDTAFVDAAYRRRVPVVVTSDPSIYVAMIHAGNTTPKKRDRQWGGFSVATVREWMGVSAMTEATP